jgi:hypothetical protein
MPTMLGSNRLAPFVRGKPAGSIKKTSLLQIHPGTSRSCHARFTKSPLQRQKHMKQPDVFSLHDEK